MKAQEILRGIPIDKSVDTTKNPMGSNHSLIRGEVFHSIADHIDSLELRIIELKAKLYDASPDKQE